jgi:hypothetical protein
VDHEYRSSVVLLGARDRVVALTGSHGNATEVVESELLPEYASNARDALAKLLGGLEPIPVEGEDPADVSATIITRSASGS